LTFPRLWGLEASRERAATLVRDAVSAVSSWGEASRQLVGLARFVLERNR